MTTSRKSRSQAKRAEILQAATELFLTHGYERVSIDAVIERVGGTKTNVYTLFGSKANLLAAVVDEACRTARIAFENLELDRLSLQTALQEIGQRYLSSLLAKGSIRQHRLMIAEAPHFPALSKRWFKAVPDATQKALADYLAGQKLRGTPSRMAGQFLSLLSGELLLRQLVVGAPVPSTREINEHVRQCISIFLNGVRG